MSTVELRASAVVALLAPVVVSHPGPPPYLPQLPGLAREWIALLRQHDDFLAMREQGMGAVVALLLILSAARDVMAGEAKEPNLVPELQAGCNEAAAVIRALEAAGIPLSARTVKLTAAERAVLETGAGPLVKAYRDQRAKGPLDGYFQAEPDRLVPSRRSWRMKPAQAPAPGPSRAATGPAPAGYQNQPERHLDPEPWWNL